MPVRTDEAKMIRKQSMANGKDYTPFQGEKLEWKESDIMNSITCATQKDNLLMIKQLNPSTESNSGTQPYQQNRIYDSEGEVPSLSREKADLLITQPSRIVGWHENENVIAAHMDDAKRSTVQEHVYHKETGQLTAMGTDHVPNIILSHYGHKDAVVSEISPTLKANSHGHEPMTFVNDKLQLRDGRDNRSTLRSGRQTELGYPGASIRRLTEIECERLQGFPDNHTQYGNYDGVIKKIPKTQRYKLMGNAVTVDIVALVASRIKLL